MMKKKQVVRRMGGGPMKKQVVKKRGGGTMTPVAMRRGGGLISERKRMAMGLPLVGSPMQKNTRRMNDLEELGRVDAERARTSKGKKNLTAEKNRIIFELARKRKPKGRLNVDDITRATNTSTQRRSKLSGMSKDQMLEKVYNLAKKIKPGGSISLDDLTRATEMLKRKRKK